MEFFGVVLFLAVGFLWWRVASLRKRIDELSARRGESEALLGELRERIERLEGLPGQSREEGPIRGIAPSEVPSVPPVPAPLPSKPISNAPPKECPVCGLLSFPTAARCDCGFRFDRPVGEVLVGHIGPPSAPARASRPEAVPAEVAGPSPLAVWWGRLREQLAGEEWETVVGASWLNKLGVLVLVIGLALFLGYSLTHMGAAGRIVVGYALSVAMLAAGITLEPRRRYVIFARGLIGGGWAALYFTTYAMHGLETSRIIDDPLLGMGLLGAVAGAMIVHSLHYRSEVVTGLAYFVGFVTLAISPASNFSILASLPLAGSLLFVAWRYSWASMAVAGVVLTYGTYAVRYDIEPTTVSVFGDFVSRQAILSIYWILFETFDLLGVPQRDSERRAALAIFPLNACGFVGVSLLQWSAVRPATLYLFLAGAAAAYLVSTIVRARIRPPGSFPQAANPLVRALAGGYEGALTFVAALTTAGIFLKFSGSSVDIALLLQAEFLFLAGLSLGEAYPRMLGALAFLIPLCKLLFVDAFKSEHMTVGSLSVVAWTPVALLTALVFYVNRSLIRPTQATPLLAGELGYSYVASGLVALALGVDLPRDYLGVGWLLLAYPLFQLGLRRGLSEFRFQAYGIGVLGVGTLLSDDLLGLGSATVRSSWLTLGPAAVLTYAGTAQFLRLSPDRLPVWERQGVRDVCSAAGTTMVALLMWHVLPAPLVAVGWGILCLFLVEIGFTLAFPALRWQGNAVAALVFGRVFLANFTNFGDTLGISHRVLTVLPLVILFYYLWMKLHAEIERGRAQAGEERLLPLYLYAPAVLAVLLIRFEAGRVLTVVGWALFTLALLAVGLHWRNRNLCWQSYGLALLTFARSWSTNFYIPESLAGVSGRLLTGALVIGSFYACEVLSPRAPEDRTAGARNALEAGLAWVELNARAVFSLLGTALLTILLFYEASGTLLTVAWGLEGVVILSVGFPMRERVLRVSGLLLLGICILKLFAYDMRELEALPRILSFVVLGLLLLGVSLIYTRFREQLTQYL